MIEREKIRTQAKEIMDEFVKALDKVENIKQDYGIDRENEVRIPGKPVHGSFRERMFRNAPKKNDGYLIMGKKNW